MHEQFLLTQTFTFQQIHHSPVSNFRLGNRTDDIHRAMVALQMKSLDSNSAGSG